MKRAGLVSAAAIWERFDIRAVAALILLVAGSFAVRAVIATVPVPPASGKAREYEYPSPPVNPTPEKLDGSHSYKFDSEDLERAEAADPSVREYCEGAVSEAQELGCLSHVEPSEVP